MNQVTNTALVQRTYGSAESLGLEAVPMPEVADDEVLIEVVAAGLDRGVWHLMTGKPYLIRILGFGFRRPKNPVLGGDVAGRVAAVGSAVERFAVGDEVMGIAKGSFAKFAVAKADKLAIKPTNLTFEQAAAATISGITALQALTKVGRIEANQRVLVIGASGGVGSFAVQIAKALDAHVTGVASGSKLDFVRSLGADEMIDYRATKLRDLAERFDLIIDIGGRTNLRTLRKLLTERGTHVIVGGENGGPLTGGMGRNLRALVMSLFGRRRQTFFISSEGREHIDALVELLAGGKVVPPVAKRVKIADAPDAIQAMADGTAWGKTVIAIGSAA